MSNLHLRPYQKAVVDAIGNQNAIVKMPTGSGKTFVAAEFIRRDLMIRNQIAKSRRQQQDTDSATVATASTASSSENWSQVSSNSSQPTSEEMTALFLVPTCNLVSQQANTVRAWIGNGYEVTEYRGGMTSPTKRFDVLVSTPQSFLTLQQIEADKKWFNWSNIFACVFDEVHHVLKDHPYRIIAMLIKGWESQNDNNSKVHILGLSASLTYAVGHRAVEVSLSNLCHDLGVTKMISPTEEELLAGGYVPQDDSIETMQKPWDVPKGVIPESDRKQHLIHEMFMTRVENRTTTHFASRIYAVVREIEREIKSQCGNVSKSESSFKSPLGQIKLTSWEDFAHKMTKKHVGALSVLYQLLEIWYVALRMVCQSWEEEEQLVIQWLVINDGFHKEGWFGPKLEASLNLVHRLYSNGGIQSEKLVSLKQHLIDKRKRKGVSFRCIIFVKQRISAYVLSQHLNNDGGCMRHGLRTGYVAARNSRITPSIKVTPGEASNCVVGFRSGEINVIVATSVIEEGFDVPEANVVISYDELKDTVELCQRFGRARQKTSCLTLMSERKDRPLTDLKDVKQHQDTIIKDFDPVKNQQKTNG
eukprot:g8229.t1 g8229   contig29:45842-48019(-)